MTNQKCACGNPHDLLVFNSGRAIPEYWCDWCWTRWNEFLVHKQSKEQSQEQSQGGAHG